MMPNRSLLLGTTVFTLIVLIAIAAPWIAPQDPLAMDPMHRLRAPSVLHWLGTDALGRDVFSRTLRGGRTSLIIGLGVSIITTIIGVAIGILAGMFRRLDPLIMRAVDALMAIPAILLAIALVTINKPTILVLIAAIALPEIPRMVRLVRAVVLTLATQPFVTAAVASGSSPARVIRLHIIPNTLAPILVQASFIAAVAIILEASLGFLGAGAPPEIASWGNIIAAGRAYIRTAPWIILSPGTALALTVLSINLVGDGLRDALDPRLTHFVTRSIR